MGYMSGKLLLKLDAITYILQHHASENFAFLDDPANSRNRSTFYYILARLLFMEDTPSKFKTFVAPLQQVLPDSLAGAAACLDALLQRPAAAVLIGGSPLVAALLSHSAGRGVTILLCLAALLGARLVRWLAGCRSWWPCPAPATGRRARRRCGRRCPRTG